MAASFAFLIISALFANVLGGDATQNVFQEPIPRIIGGSATIESRFPYYVALRRKGGTLLCGGTLIASDVVLTAAHCQVDGLVAMVGRHKQLGMNTNDDEWEEIQVESFHIHPDFDYDERRFDQMLLKLVSPSTQPYLQHVNLDDEVPASGESKLATIGLGTKDLDGNSPEVLQRVDLTYVPYSQCKEIKNDNLDFGLLIEEDALCTIGDEASACHGDSGGPQLILGATASDDIQVGIISWYALLE